MLARLSYDCYACALRNPESDQRAIDKTAAAVTMEINEFSKSVTGNPGGRGCRGRELLRGVGQAPRAKH